MKYTNFAQKPLFTTVSHCSDPVEGTVLTVSMINGSPEMSVIYKAILSTISDSRLSQFARSELKAYSYCCDFTGSVTSFIDYLYNQADMESANGGIPTDFYRVAQCLFEQS